MAIKVGSNFSFNGEQFLDNRQNIAKSEKDLKNWSNQIPEGFETCIDGIWYYYSTKEPENKITGRFHKKISQRTDGADGGVNSTLSQSVLSKILMEAQKKIDDLDNSVFPVEIEIITGNKTLEMGASIIPKISWRVIKKGEEIQPKDATVNGSTQYIDDTRLNYNAVFPINKSEKFLVKVYYGDITVEETVVYDFRFKRYWGTSNKAELTDSDILKFSSEFAYGRAKGPTTFDCTGGKYPYYVIPAEYSSGLDIWVGGLRNNDFTIMNRSVTNSLGVSHNYSIVRLNNIQTGVLKIEFK